MIRSRSLGLRQKTWNGSSNSGALVGPGVRRPRAASSRSRRAAPRPPPRRRAARVEHRAAPYRQARCPQGACEVHEIDAEAARGAERTLGWSVVHRIPGVDFGRRPRWRLEGSLRAARGSAAASDRTSGGDVGDNDATRNVPAPVQRREPSGRARGLHLALDLLDDARRFAAPDAGDVVLVLEERAEGVVDHVR